MLCEIITSNIPASVGSSPGMTDIALLWREQTQTTIQRFHIADDVGVAAAGEKNIQTHSRLFIMNAIYYDKAQSCHNK